MGSFFRAMAAASAIQAFGCGSAGSPKPEAPIHLHGPNGENLPPVTRPKLIAAKAPTYTKEACDAKVEGTAVAKCVITAEGTTRDCRMIKRLRYLNEAILAVLPEWRFTPATSEGKPVDVSYIIPIKIEPPPCFGGSRRSDALSSAALQDPPPEWNSSMTRPTLLEGPPPTYTEEAMAQRVEGIVRVSCVVSEQGRLEECMIAQGLPLMNDAILAVLPEWRFSPATLNGQPVRVIYTIPIRFVAPPDPRANEPTRPPNWRPPPSVRGPLP
jgi:protein TonB